MGYFTTYKLKTYYPQIEINKILSNLNKNEFSELHKALNGCGFGFEVKWYDHEEDMKKLSIKFPDIIFCLNGRGEDDFDLWKKYFKNGKIQVCEADISFDKYDEKKLK